MRGASILIVGPIVLMAFALNRHMVSYNTNSLRPSRLNYVMRASKVLNTVWKTRHVVTAFHDTLLILTRLLSHGSNFIFTSQVQGCSSLLIYFWNIFATLPRIKLG